MNARRVSLIVACMVVVVSGGRRTSADQTPHTVWEGVYTAAQAERGQELYKQSCVACHRDDLRGDNTAPSLVGESFLFLWGDMSVGELSVRIRKVMPPDRPGSLTAQNYIDIIAFILQKNAFPAGDAELGIDHEVLQQIRITTTRPSH